jgi:hypothetical protein
MMTLLWIGAALFAGWAILRFIDFVRFYYRLRAKW